MSDKKVVLQFISLTFCIAYVTSGVLIILGHFGYRVYSLVHSFRQFALNLHFAIYILSPAISSYIVLKKNSRITGFREWLKTVFETKNKSFVYLIIFAGLVLYFGMHIAVSGRMDILSSILVGAIWIFWHIPLFFIPGTSHCEGLIDFWMFNVQVMSLSFFRGAIYKIAGKGYVFPFVLFHTMFNSASSLFAPAITTWKGTAAANAAVILFSVLIVGIYNRTQNLEM